jgi:pyruvate-formate lyase
LVTELLHPSKHSSTSDSRLKSSGIASTPSCVSYDTYTAFACTSLRLREEVTEQIRALEELKQMAATYGYDISKPATR